jgi:catechol-2,3-dioxygenase
MRARIADKRVMGLVKAFLQAGVLSEAQANRETITGTPQGGILSPCLANIALTVLDEHFARKWEALGPPQPDGVAGLHHVALAYPTRRSLADAYRRLKQANWPIRQTADHGTHEAIYVTDPDGNDVELMWDRPLEAWPRDEAGHLSGQFGPGLDLDELLGELQRPE